jgi:acetylornithine/succinyldiaminopimelate/putrescine aminotransferase/acyl-CoA synthetase (AMP-forming)/AMP-acid ligase II/predicted amino acid dehydrogenase/acyl carrier protein
VNPTQHPTRRFSSFVELLRARAAARPEGLAYTFLAEGETEAGRLTFAELDRKARAVGALLQELKAGGERVLLLCPAGLEYVVAFYGCLYAGAVAVPSYPPRMNRNLGRLLNIIEDSRPRVAITVSGILANIRKHFGRGGPLDAIHWLSIDEATLGHADEWRDAGAGRDTLAFLQYTSGSTSTPKGVVITHGHLLHNEAMMKVAFNHTDETVMISWLPLYHDMGLIGVILASLYNGVPAYLMSPADFLMRPVTWLNAFTRYRGTFAGAPNFAYDLCVQKVSAEQRERLDLSAWRVACNGAEPVRAETLERFRKTFAPCGLRPEVLYPCYGLAEATLFVSGGGHASLPQVTAFDKNALAAGRAAPAAEPGEGERLVSCGTAWLDERVVVVNPETLRKSAEGEVGEIWVGGGTVAGGYWENREATAETFDARTSDTGEGPFLRTGDLGVMYGGELYVTGRMKDLILLRGRNIYPHDIEFHAELSHPALRPGGSAAFSVERGGEEHLVVVAEVAREQRKKLDTGDIVERVRRALASEYEVGLHGLALISPGTLPKTSSGKVQRRATRDAYLSGKLEALYVWQEQADGAAGVGAPPPEQVARVRASLEGWLALELSSFVKVGPEAIDVHKPLAAYGLDSLAAAELTTRVREKFKVTLAPDTLFRGEPSVAGVALHISELLGGRNGKGDGATRQAAAPVRQNVAAEVREVAPASGASSSSSDAKVESHPYLEFVNPVLGRLLSQLELDKSYVRGEGCYLYDREGRRYLDFLAQYGALPFGFNHPRIWEAVVGVRERAEPSFVQPSYLEAAGELARKLIEIAPPGLRYVTFANSGAEAVEAAIKLCKSATGRAGVLAASNGFHGKTLAALSATDKEKYQKGFGAPVAGYDYVPFGDADALARALAGRGYAAFIVEPIQGEGGIVEAPPGYLAQARELCREAGTLFVVDEIQTGLGRTGMMFACEAEGVAPDVMTLAKALGGGLVPIGACLCTKDVYHDDFALKHTSTFAANTLACRVGLATVELLEADNRALVRQVANNGARLKQALLALRRKHAPVLGEVRGRGYMLGLTFGIDRYNWDSGLLGLLGETEVLSSLVVSNILHHEGVRLGYTLNHGGVVRVEPPLIATWADCEYFLEAFERTLRRLGLRSTAHFTAHLTGADADAEEARPLERKTFRRLAPAASDGRFAFLVHPLDERSYADVDPSLAGLSDAQIRRLSESVADNFDPFVVGDARVVSATGEAAYGEFVIVARTAAELSRMNYRDALSEIEAAGRLAHKRGARLVGLGAYTSIVTRGGLYLPTERPFALTTGNSFTAYASMKAVAAGLGGLGRELSRSTVAVVGATGSIGRAASLLLAQEARALTLVGNPEHEDASRRRLLEVAGEALFRLDGLARDGRRFAADTFAASALAWLDARPRPASKEAWADIAAEAEKMLDSLTLTCDNRRWLPQADVLLTAAGAVNSIVNAEHLKAGALVCDISRPSNVSRELKRERPDVHFIDGGVVSLPAGSSLNFNFGLAENHVYACMAETMMLALEGRYQDCSLGLDLDISQVLEFGRRAERHGFGVAAGAARPRK